MQTLERRFTHTGTYVIDPVHSRVGFAARHAMLSTVRGVFDRINGGGHFDIERPENSFVDTTIDATSVDTRHHEGDVHRRSVDFLDVATHPEITFSGTSVEQVGVRTHRVIGDPTVKGITNPVVMVAEPTGWATQDDDTQRIEGAPSSIARTGTSAGTGSSTAGVS
jgi:polyisoprenoid-binding protein YceI